METPPSKKATGAFTVIELLVVVAVIVVLILMLTPALDHRPVRATTVGCINNLRQIGLGFYMFGDDHDNRFPPQTRVTNGGRTEFVTKGSPALQFSALTNFYPQLSRDWLFKCPADKAKHAPTNFAAGFDDRNVSYFVSTDATPAMTNCFLAGDRNLEVSGQPVKPGLFALRTNGSIKWTRELHSKSAGKRSGNILFADAHVEMLQEEDLSRAAQRQGLATNRLALP